MTDNKYPIGGFAPGNYQCKCCTCGSEFIGDKRAVQCEPCAVSEKERFDALSPSEQQELINGNVEVFKKWYNALPDSGEVEILKAENEKMRKALEKSLEWIADIKQKDIPLDDKKGMALYHIKWLATEALK